MHTTSVSPRATDRPVRVLVVGFPADPQPLRELFQRARLQLTGLVATLDEAGRSLAHHRPDVVLLGRLAGETTLPEAIARCAPVPCVVLVNSPDPRAAVRAAFAAGAADVLLDLNARALIKTIWQVANDQRCRSAARSPDESASFARLMARRSPGSIVVVTAPKAGVGVSTVAAGLALAFASIGRRVLACDLDENGPSLGLLLGQTPKRVGTTFPRRGDPRRPVDVWEIVEPSALPTLTVQLSRLRAHADRVVVDTRWEQLPSILPALTPSDQLLGVVVDEPVTLRAWQRALGGWQPDAAPVRLALIVNQALANADAPPGDLHPILQVPVLARLSTNFALRRAPLPLVPEFGEIERRLSPPATPPAS